MGLYYVVGPTVLIPVEVALQTAPIGSLAQILVCAKFGTQGGSRASCVDRDQLVNQVNLMQVRLGQGDIPLEEIDKAIAMYRIIPKRIELCRSGTIWERFEWRNIASEAEKEMQWSQPRRLLPY